MTRDAKQNAAFGWSDLFSALRPQVANNNDKPLAESNGHGNFEDEPEEQRHNPLQEIWEPSNWWQTRPKGGAGVPCAFILFLCILVLTVRAGSGCEGFGQWVSVIRTNSGESRRPRGACML